MFSQMSYSVELAISVLNKKRTKFAEILVICQLRLCSLEGMRPYCGHTGWLLESWNMHSRRTTNVTERNTLEENSHSGFLFFLS